MNNSVSERLRSLSDRSSSQDEDSNCLLFGLSDKARDTIIQKKMQDLFKNELKRMSLREFCGRYVPSSTLNSLALDKFEEIEDKDQFGTKIAKKDIIGFFVTISPPLESVSAFKLVNDAKKKYFKESEAFSEVFFVIEQGSETLELMGKHPHLHILLKLNKDSSTEQSQPSKARKRIENHWKEYISDGQHAVDICPVSANTWPKKLKYIYGDKDDSKKAQVEVDQQWRESQGFVDIYMYP